MNVYAMVGSSCGTRDALALSIRLSAWHDAMVAHERLLRVSPTRDICGDECPHAEAAGLWSEALATLGERAGELTFLQARAMAAPRRHPTAIKPYPMEDTL